MQDEKRSYFGTFNSGWINFIVSTIFLRSLQITVKPIMTIRDNIHYINIPDTSKMTFHVHTALHAPSLTPSSLSQTQRNAEWVMNSNVVRGHDDPSTLC